jgi:hypothetical protein
MIVRAVLSLMLVHVLMNVTRVRMLVRVLMFMPMVVHVGVLMRMGHSIVRVLVRVGMSMFVLMLVTVIVLTFHRIPLPRIRPVENRAATSILAPEVPFGITGAASRVRPPVIPEACIRRVSTGPD